MFNARMTISKPIQIHRDEVGCIVLLSYRICMLERSECYVIDIYLLYEWSQSTQKPIEWYGFS